ncbi:hypothetical protein Tco_1420804 [Tanacetum coccineum]
MMVGSSIYTVTYVLTQMELDLHCATYEEVDSLKNWNNHFFWIDATVFPLSVPWFNGTLIVKDPLLVEDAVDFLCMELLNLNRTVIQKYPETFHCLVGLTRSFTENDVRPTLLCDDDEEMGLLDFVQSIDPFKVKTRERTLATDERARTKDVAISDARPATAGKSPAALQRLVKQSASEAIGFGFAVPATEDLASFVTPTFEREYEDDSDHGNNVVSSTIAVGSEDEVRDISAPETKAEGSSISETETGTLSTTPNHSSTDDFYDSQSVDSATAGDVYVPHWSVTNGARIDNPTTYRNFLDHVTPPGYWAALCNQSNAGFFNCFNINSAQHTSKRDHDTEIADLKAKLGKDESEAAEVGKVAGGMKMREEFKSVQDAMARRFDERVTEMNGHIADVKRDMDEHLYLHMFTAIVGRWWVIGHGGFKGRHKAWEEGRLLAQIEAYDPETEAKFMATISEFKNVSFPLLDELEGLRDSLLTPIMSALTLKDDHANVDTSPSFSGFQPSLDQVSIPIYSESGEVIREMLLSKVVPFVIRSAERMGLCPPSNPAPSTSIGVSDYQISTLASPHDDLFDTVVLDKPVDA